MTIEELESKAVVADEDDEWDVEPDFWEAVGLLQGVYDLINQEGTTLRRLPNPTYRKVLKVKKEVAEFLMQYDTEEET